LNISSPNSKKRSEKINLLDEENIIKPVLVGGLKKSTSLLDDENN
jgi:hypothetical protein